jgi:hypothetical protein
MRNIHLYKREGVLCFVCDMRIFFSISLFFYRISMFQTDLLYTAVHLATIYSLRFYSIFLQNTEQKECFGQKIRIHRKSIWSVNLKQWEYNVRSNESLEIYIYFIFFQERTILCRMDQDDHGHNPFGLGQQVGTCMHVYWLWLGSVEGRDYMAVRD